MRKPYANILDAIGDTPLVRLNKVVPEGAAEVWVKCEFLNPAGSIKDRMARYIVEEAERRDWLKPGGTIVENTSGNTGLGLAMVAAVKGYKCVFTMPDKMSLEKVNMLKGFGAEVVITPTDVPGEASVYKVEGIGDDIVCDAFDTKAVDEIRQTDDRQAFTMARRLTREEGLFCGGSSGAIVHVAIEVAKELGAGKKVVCVLPDHGSRYISKYLSDAWMKDYGFMEPERQLGRVEDVLRVERPPVVTASPETPLREVVHLFREHGVSQVPLVNGSGKPERIVHEVDLLRAMQAGDVSLDQPASAVATAVGGLVYPKARVEELYSIFAKDQVAIVVDGSRIVGIVSQIDLIDYLSRKAGA